MRLVRAIYYALPRFCPSNKMDALPELLEVLKELGPNFEDWYPLGLFLGIPRQELAAIRVSEGPNLKMQFIKMVEKWLDTKPNATWEQLCQALRDIRQDALAERISAARRPPSSRTNTTASVSPTQAEGERQNQVASDPQTACRIDLPEIPEDEGTGIALAKASEPEKRNISFEFSSTFAKIVQLLGGLVPVETLKSSLKGFIHLTTQQPYIDNQLYGQCQTTEKVLESLRSRYINATHTYLLRKIVEKFGNDEVKQKLEEYDRKFPLSTPLEQLGNPLSDEEIAACPSSQKVKVVIEGDASRTTMKDVQEVRVALARNTRTDREFIVYIRLSNQSVAFIFLLPESVVSRLGELRTNQKCLLDLAASGIIRIEVEKPALLVIDLNEEAGILRKYYNRQHRVHVRSNLGSSESFDTGFSEKTSGQSSRRSSISEADEIQSHDGDERALQFADKLRTNNTGHSEKFNKTTISDEVATSLGDALSKNKSLRELELVYCKISPYGVSSLATALRTNTSLRTLRLHDCGLSDQSTEHLAEALQENTTLLELDLGKASCRNKITSQGASAVAGMLCINKTLKDLSLFGNDISDIGVRELAEALQNNESLEKLDLSTTKVTADGASALAETLRKNNSLKKLYLWGNKLSDSGMSSLAEALKENKSLEELDLCFNMISDEGVKALSAALRVNESLKFLWFSFDIATDTGADALVTAIEENNTLTRLELVRTSDMISEDLQKSLKEIAEIKGLELTLL